MTTETIYNYHKINEQLITAGQPTADQLRAAAAEGFTTVINLAVYDQTRTLFDEAHLVQSLGLRYYHIPVEWHNPTPADFAQFAQILDQLAPADKTLIHCAANFRVTAFYSLYAMKQLGWSETQAEQFRAIIWHGSNYPIWENFMATIMAEMA